MAREKFFRGQRVRLKKDLYTRGKKVYRTGLTMTISGTDGGVCLFVWVRGHRHLVLLTKKNAPYYLEAVGGHHPVEGSD